MACDCEFFFCEGPLAMGHLLDHKHHEVAAFRVGLGSTRGAACSDSVHLDSARRTAPELPPPA